jgi:hypothetical protein
MWLIFFGFREGAVDIEVSPVINRHTPKMYHGIYSFTFRNFDNRYKKLPHLTPRGNSTTGVEFCVFFRIITDLKYRISFYTAHCLEAQKYGAVGGTLFLNISIKLLKPTGYVMHQHFNIQKLYALPTLYLFILYLSQKGGLRGSWWENRMERDHQRDKSVDGCIMLAWISFRLMWVCGLDWAGPG